MFKSHIKVWHSIQLSNDVEVVVDIQIVQIQCESGIEAGTLKLEIHNEFWQRLTEISELEKRVSGAKICTKKRGLARHAILRKQVIRCESLQKKGFWYDN